MTELQKEKETPLEIISEKDSVDDSVRPHYFITVTRTVPYINPRSVFSRKTLTIDMSCLSAAVDGKQK